MEKALIANLPVEKALAFANLQKNIYRTVSLLVLIAISSAVLFASLILSSKLKAGIAALRSQLGADLLVVPEGYEKGAEAVLLSGDANYFYMEKTVLDSVRKIEGVEQASSQFYLTSLSESCCDFPIQIIGFDPESDFTVQNWSKKRLSGTLQDEYILAGANLSLTKGKVKLFGTEYKVTAKLLKNGTGMDNTIFCDSRTLKQMFQDAKQKGFAFISNGDTENRISTVLVKLSPGSHPDSVTLRIKNAISNVQVISGEQFLKTFSKKLSYFLLFFNIIAILILIITVFALAIVFSLLINERKREFSILRVLGANRKTLQKILLLEAGLLGTGGSILGISLSSLLIFPFFTLISEKISLPFGALSFAQTVIFGIFTFSLCVFSVIFSAINGAIRLGKVEPYGGAK